MPSPAPDVDLVVVQVPVQTFTRMDDRLKWLVWLMGANLGLGIFQADPAASLGIGVAYVLANW